MLFPKESKYSFNWEPSAFVIVTTLELSVDVILTVVMPVTASNSVSVTTPSSATTLVSSSTDTMIPSEFLIVFVPLPFEDIMLSSTVPSV